MAVEVDVETDAAQQPDRRGDVVERGDVFQNDRLLGQQGGRQDGQGRVLGAGDPDLARQARTADDFQFVQIRDPVRCA